MQIRNRPFPLFFFVALPFALGRQWLARERGTFGCTTRGDGAIDRVSASAAEWSLLKPSLSGSQRAADPSQGVRGGLPGHGGGMVAWWCFGAGEGKSDRMDLPVLAFPQAWLPCVH